VDGKTRRHGLTAETGGEKRDITLWEIGWPHRSTYLSPGEANAERGDVRGEQGGSS